MLIHVIFVLKSLYRMTEFNINNKTIFITYTKNEKIPFHYDQGPFALKKDS